MSHAFLCGQTNAAGFTINKLAVVYEQQHQESVSTRKHSSVFVQPTAA